MAAPDFSNPGREPAAVPPNGSIDQLRFVPRVQLPGVPLGQIVATPNALSQVSAEEILHGLQRHRNRDWGNVDSSDRAANDQALQEGTRILSAYRTQAGVTYWIITEADRSVTTILLPEDY